MSTIDALFVLISDFSPPQSKALFTSEFIRLVRVLSIQENPYQALLVGIFWQLVGGLDTGSPENVVPSFGDIRESRPEYITQWAKLAGAGSSKNVRYMAITI